jgi:GNAT superfamily N-acetyltransferase
MQAGAEGIEVRQLGVQDAARYHALRLEGLRAYPHAHQTAYEEGLDQPEAWAVQRLSTPGDCFFGAFEGERLVGAICLRTQQGSKIRHAAEVKALTVDPLHQSRGVGRALISHLIAHARALGHIRQLKLTVIDGNTRAERIYDAFGFRQFGFEPGAFLYDGKYCAKQHRQLFLDSPQSHE